MDKGELKHKSVNAAILMKNSGSFKILDKIGKLKGNSHYIEDENILYYQGSQVLLIPKERDVTVTLDGEPFGILSAIFKVYRKALTIKTTTS